MEQQFGQCLAYGHLVAQLGLRSQDGHCCLAVAWLKLRTGSPPSRESFIPGMGEMKQQNLLRPFSSLANDKKSQAQPRLRVLSG